MYEYIDIYINLYKADRYSLFGFAVVAGNFIYRFRYVLQHQIQVHFIFLETRNTQLHINH